jgi:type II secretory pathway pseudopilin PulG
MFMRRRGLRSARSQITNHKSQILERGYMMITLMLAIALITIAMLAVLPDIRQQIRRDREEELMHRGTAYMRAIQHYYKKLGRYPSKIEDLENTNNMHFLRKHYTDPVNRDPATGKEKEFKLLHQQDISLNNGPVLGQTPSPTANGPNAFGAPPVGQHQPPSAGAPTSASSDSSNPSSGDSSGAVVNSNSTGSSSANSDKPDNGSSSPFNGPTFGGGPFLGVASTSKEKTIRVFFDKNHYKDWLFIYIPGLERGGLLTGPVNPNAQAGGIGGLNPGQMPGGSAGQMPGQGFGQGQGGGLPSNFGQSPTPPGTQSPPGAGQPPPQ